MRQRTELFSRGKERKYFRRRASPANSRAHADFAGRGSRINFAAPASEKLSPTTAVYLGGTAPHTVAAKSPAKSR